MQVSDDAALLIGLLNTAHLPDGAEALHGSTPAQWRQDGRSGDGRSLHSTSPTPAGAAQRRRLAALAAMREGLRATLIRRQQTGGDAAVDERIASADRALGACPLRVTLGADGSVDLAPPAVTSEGDWLPIAASSLLRAQLDGSLARVRVCAEQSCRWAFFDASRNASRLWCSMAGCGNVAKNRAYRARRASGVPASIPNGRA